MQTDSKSGSFKSGSLQLSIKKALERAETALKSVRDDPNTIQISDPVSVAILEETVERYQALLKERSAGDV